VFGYGREGLRAQAPPNVAADAAGGDITWGADIGVPVTLQVDDGAGGTAPLTFLFFGDTDLLDQKELADHKRVRPYQAKEGELAATYGVLQGDAVGLTTDTNPDDGLALSHLMRNREGSGPRACDQVDDRGFRAMYVPGVHPGPCAAALSDGTDVFWLFNTPTGAWGMEQTLLVMVADQTFYDGIPQASSYLAASTDYGLTWTALNGGRPFSSPEVSGWPLAKFVHVDAVPVDAAQYQDSARSGPCLLPLPQGDDTRGYLLFGGGLWTQSDVYLAFVARKDLQTAVADPGQTLPVWYFKGASADGKCWSTDQKDAVAVVNGYDNTSYAAYELACGNHVVQDTVGTGYISVAPLRGRLAGGRQVDRLLMLFNSGYVVCLAGEGDACCGGTPVDGGRMCANVDGETYASRLVEGNAGIVFITGERWRPWIWNTPEAPSLHGGVVPAATSRRLVPVTIPPDPAANWYGAGPVCTALRSDTDVINGYAPLAIDTFTRVSDRGDGFDLYFLLSRWGVKRTPDDPGDKDKGYNYIVDLFRTTIRPTGVPRASRPAARARASAQPPGRAAAEGRRGAEAGGVIR